MSFEIHTVLSTYVVFFYSITELELYKRKTLTIKANTGTPTSFLIKAKDLGYISLKLTATSKLAGDAIEKKLLVKV